MMPVELAELKIQPQDLQDMDFIRPREFEDGTI
jgi:hypothetical protein